MKTSCECCAKGANCLLQYDEERRAQCSILNADNQLPCMEVQGANEEGSKSLRASASPRCSSPIVREEELLQEIANQLTAKGIAIPAQSRDAGMAEIVKRYVRKILIGESGITVKIPEERVA